MSRERRLRRARDNLVEAESSVVVVDEHEESCIDLTGDDTVVIDEQVELIDLSSPTDVVETTIEVTQPVQRRSRRSRTSGQRRPARQRARHGVELEVIQTEEPEREREPRATQNREQGAIQIDDDDSDSDLPDIELGPGTPYVPDTTFTGTEASSSLKLTCPVCLDDVSKIKAAGGTVMSTICGHIFCSTCIGNTLRQHASMKMCPTCRKKISAKTVHRLYI